MCIEVQCMSEGFSECKFVCCHAKTSAEIVSLALAAASNRKLETYMLALAVPQPSKSLHCSKRNTTAGRAAAE